MGLCFQVFRFVLVFMIKTFTMTLIHFTTNEIQTCDKVSNYAKLDYNCLNVKK